jgi:hypothetical protein
MTIRRAAELLGMKPYPVLPMAEASDIPGAVRNGRRFVALEDVVRLEGRS